MEARVSAFGASLDMLIVNTRPAASALPSSSSSSPSASPSHGAATRCSHGLLRPTCHDHVAHLKMDVLMGCRYGLSQPRKSPKIFSVRANINDKEFMNPMAPFQLQSPTGLFLAELLHSDPDLVPAAVEHELEMLAENREAEASQNQSIASGTDVILYRRIAELKSQERFNALEEILYTLIVQKFVEAGVAMVPNVPILASMDISWPVQVKELESVHPTEALGLIREHSLLVLGKRGATNNYFSQSMFAHMSKMSMKEIYATSITYGYFLRRLHNRFQLEKSMKLYPNAAGSLRGVGGRLGPDISAAMAVLRDLRGSNQTSNSTQVMTSEFLAYIMSFDVESLRGFATVRSEESRSLLNKHTMALFKGPDIHMTSDGSMRVGGKDEGSEINFLRLKGLVLEAVAFGSFLWDVETYVDSYYSLV